MTSNLETTTKTAFQKLKNNFKYYSEITHIGINREIDFLRQLSFNDWKQNANKSSAAIWRGLNKEYNSFEELWLDTKKAYCWSKNHVDYKWGTINGVGWGIAVGADNSEYGFETAIIAGGIQFFSSFFLGGFLCKLIRKFSRKHKNPVVAYTWPTTKAITLYYGLYYLPLQIMAGTIDFYAIAVNIVSSYPNVAPVIYEERNNKNLLEKPRKYFRRYVSNPVRGLFKKSS